MATTSAIEGNVGASLPAAGGVQVGSMGPVVEVGGELGGGAVSIGGSTQLQPRERHSTIIRQVSRYFRFIPFMVTFIVARGVKFGQRAFVATALLCKGGKICYTSLIRVRLPEEK
jgi:hypothetical protein